jgi:ATP-dependent DNA helicase RecG
LIEDAMAFFKFSIAQDHSLENYARRKDKYLYPLEALREGIVNALCHRDYTITGSTVRIFVFQDSIEIRSPGGLANTLTLENMHYRQFTRNQMIASFLAGFGYMERRGKGLLKIQRLCNESGLNSSFLLTPDKNEFIVTFSQHCS